MGFRRADRQIIETLLSMFRQKLDVPWVLDAGPAAGCALVLCDIDSSLGREAWNAGAPSGAMLAKVTSGFGHQGNLVLRRPLRGHGPQGLVHVFNLASAERTGRPPSEGQTMPPGADQPGPAAPPPIAASAYVPPPVPQGLAPPPAWPASTPPPAVPDLISPPAMLASTPSPVTPDPAPPPASAAPAVAVAMPHAPAQPAAVPSFALPPVAPSTGSLAALRPTPAATQDEKPSRKGTEKVSDEDDLLDAMHRMRFRSRGIPMREVGLLAALRPVMAMQHSAVLTLPGLPALCLSPRDRAYSSEASAADIARALTSALIPVRVVPYGDPEEAREAAGILDGIPRSIDQLTWLACVRCPDDDTTRHESSVYRLRRWPDLGQVPHEPHHLRWCGVLSRQPSTMRALAAATGSQPRDVAAFLDACAELQILEGRPATQAELESITVPEVSQQAKQVRERISLLRTILTKLGIRKS